MSDISGVLFTLPSLGKLSVRVFQLLLIRKNNDPFMGQTGPTRGKAYGLTVFHRLIAKGLLQKLKDSLLKIST
jgi:hypothetical protein